MDETLFVVLSIFTVLIVAGTTILCILHKFCCFNTEPDLDSTSQIIL